MERLPRPTLLLALLAAPGGPVRGSLRLHRLVFLAQRHRLAAQLFDETYVFYRDFTGPVSPGVEDDLEFLSDLGMVEVKTEGNPRTDAAYSATQRGAELIDDLAGRDPGFAKYYSWLAGLKADYNGLPLDRFLFWFAVEHPNTYWPWMATSVIKRHVTGMGEA